MARLLLVDDEPNIVMAVKDELEFEGLEVHTAADGNTGIELARQIRPEVMVLDLMLPGLNGFEVCRRLRSEMPDLWILLLTARGQEADRVTGFEAGADDYVVKPFSLRELVARIKVGLRRKDTGNRLLLEFGSLKIDRKARQVEKAGREVSLTRTEFDLLALLARRAGEVLSRDELRDVIWGADVYVTQRVIDTHIATLRKKLETDPNQPQHILSVRGVGYKFSSSRRSD